MHFRVENALNITKKDSNISNCASPSLMSKNNQQYAVEKILDVKSVNGDKHYLVKWVGFSKKSDQTWEPESHLISCPEVIQEFESSRKSNIAIRSTSRAIRTSSSQAIAKRKEQANSSDPDYEDDDEIYQENQNQKDTNEEDLSKNTKRQTAIKSNRSNESTLKSSRLTRKTAESGDMQEEENLQENQNDQQSENLNRLCTGYKGKCLVLSMFRKKNGQEYFLKVKNGKEEKIVPRKKLYEEDPYSLLSFFEKNIKFVK